MVGEPEDGLVRDEFAARETGFLREADATNPSF